MISLNSQQLQHPLHSGRPADDMELEHFFSIPITGEADAIYQLGGGATSPGFQATHRQHSDSQLSSCCGESPIKLEDSGWSEENAWVGFQLNRSTSNFTSQSSVDSPGADHQHMESPSCMEVDSSKQAKAFDASSVGWKLNHSEVEKQRRDKMNAFIYEMVSLVPMCRSASRKLDKLTVLRMTTQHLKTLRLRRLSAAASGGGGGSGVYGSGQADASQLFSSAELQKLIHNNFDGFSLVVSCDRARILYASKCDAFSRRHEIAPLDLIGQNLLEVVHPKDVNLVKEQLTVPELSGIVAHGSEPSATMHWLQRRFFCRFRTDAGTSPRRKGVARQYEHLHCNGFIHWPAAGSQVPQPSAADADDEIVLAAATATAPAAVAEPEPRRAAQLVLLCRPAAPADLAGLPARVRPEAATQFNARLSLEGRVTWVDQRVTPLLGHMPQDLQDASLYDLVGQEDLHRLSVAHASALKAGRSRVTLQRCRLRSGWVSGEEVLCSLSLQCFANPLTQSPEFLSLTATLMSEQPAAAATSAAAEAAPADWPRIRCRSGRCADGETPPTPPLLSQLPQTSQPPKLPFLPLLPPAPSASAGEGSEDEFGNKLAACGDGMPWLL